MQSGSSRVQFSSGHLAACLEAEGKKALQEDTMHSSKASSIPSKIPNDQLSTLAVQRQNSLLP